MKARTLPQILNDERAAEQARIAMLADDRSEKYLIDSDAEEALLEQVNNSEMDFDESDEERIERIFNGRMYQ